MLGDKYNRRVVTGMITGFTLIVSLVYCRFVGHSGQPLEDWGFFAHKRINRLAVFTLPEEMLPLYKPRVEYIAEHAVDPDKRRYATKFEGARHYIDIDQWGAYPFDDLPRDLHGAVVRYSKIIAVRSVGDTLKAEWGDQSEGLRLQHPHPGLAKMRYVDFQNYYNTNLASKYYEGPYFEATGLNRFFGQDTFAAVFVEDQFSEHGILPYNLLTYQERLTSAFRRMDMTAILRYSTEIGHYIGDAHVPLHTTTNYNGQLTNQVGIHGFWESRIPELFADDTYDYFVGRAELIDNLSDYYWNIVLESHVLVDSVLQIEKRLSETFPKDQQYCYQDRNYRNVLLPCPAYAQAYSDAMNGMVEERFRAAVHAIGSSWYTAWYHAGQPDLSLFGDSATEVTVDTLPQQPNRQIYGRQHWD